MRWRLLALLLLAATGVAGAADNAACELTQASLDHIIRWEVG